MAHGKTALITGGGSGIGEAAALAFAQAGYRVALVGRRPEALTHVAERIRHNKGEALILPADVSRAADAEQIVAQTIAQFGPLDAAFNNAGIEGAFAPIVDLSEDDFDATIATNLKGVWLSCREQMRAMGGRGGAIVNTSSWLAHGAFPGSSIYSASKAALDGMLRALAMEGAPEGIRVNNVNPGIIDTPMFRRFADDAAAQPFIQHTPVRRLGTPEEVADVVVWLASDGARFVTGQNILLDGGYTLAGHRAWLSGGVSASNATPE